jgi:predicted short-subunit dehydrogenase-like oxidoreductase (DUF2520 family)
MKISFIGAGNVAFHLAQALQDAGNQIITVYSRKLQNATYLAEKLENVKAQDHLDFSTNEAELFIVALADNALPEVLPKLRLPQATILVHTSGSLPLVILENIQAIGINKGVFYPLQTFSKFKAMDFAEIPFCIEAEDLETEAILFDLAQSLSQKVSRVTSQQRRILHLAAVFACNFANHLWVIAQEILSKEKLSLDLLKPVIRETVEKALTTNPLDAQTGPARRKDTAVIETHLAMLEETVIRQEIYNLITQDIIYSNKIDLQKLNELNH